MSLTVCLKLTNDDNAPPLLLWEMEGDGHIYTYLEAVNCLLNLYITNDVIAETESEILSFEKYNNQMAIQLSEELKDKALKLKDTFSEKSTKSAINEELPLNHRENVRICCGARPTMHLGEVAQ